LYDKCNPPVAKEYKFDVDYTILASNSAAKTFKGFACRMWMKELSLTEFFWGSTDTFEKSAPFSVGAQDCWHLVQTANCKGNQMVRDGNAWRYEAEPKGEAKWMQTMSYKSFNCIFEETTFEQECSTCNITTVTGSLGSEYNAGSAIQGHFAYVWTVNNEFTNRECSERIIFSGPATLIRVPTEPRSSAIIRDSVRQLDFHLISKVQEYCNKTNVGKFFVYNVYDEPSIKIQLSFDLIVTAKDMVGGIIRVLPAVTVSQLAPPADLKVNDKIQSHLQWMEDKFTLQLNTVVPETQHLECASRRSRKINLVVLSRFSPAL
jgi:hypothetical protein